MAGRSRPTFLKRQKELARKEKQRAKADRKMQRKQDPASSAQVDDWNPPADEAPEGDTSDPERGSDFATAPQ